MPPRRVSRSTSSAEPGGTAFDRITVAAFVITSALTVGMVLSLGPAEALHHIAAALSGVADWSTASFDPAYAAQMTF